MRGLVRAAAEPRQSASQKPSEVQATTQGIEWATFGEMAADGVAAWLDRHLYQRPSLGVQTVRFRVGQLTAVSGLRLTNGAAAQAPAFRPGESGVSVSVPLPQNGRARRSLQGCS